MDVNGTERRHVALANGDEKGNVHPLLSGNHRAGSPKGREHGIPAIIYDVLSK
jgi:hypothetical protein